MRAVLTANVHMFLMPHVIAALVYNANYIGRRFHVLLFQSEW